MVQSVKRAFHLNYQYIISAIKQYIFSENLEALERGELKFSCSYDEGDNFGDSCGSAESGEGSDSENDGDNAADETEYVRISAIKEEDLEEDIDLEVCFSIYYHLKYWE